MVQFGKYRYKGSQNIGGAGQCNNISSLNINTAHTYSVEKIEKTRVELKQYTNELMSLHQFA